jgi:signal transduction histidine kinase
LRGFAKVTRDMTERRRVETLERNERRMNEFLAMLAHELRNPLAPIRNALDLMRMKSADTSIQEWSRNVIDRQTTQLTRLVDDLLDIGRITSGKIVLKKEPGGADRGGHARSGIVSADRGPPRPDARSALRHRSADDRRATSFDSRRSSPIC